jgi:ABC-type transport system substrate-binding protein
LATASRWDPFSAGLDFWALTEEELAPYITPNYDRARELLAEAGYPDGLDIDIETSQGVQFYIDNAEIAIPELAKSGIRANLQLSDLSTYLSTKLFAADFGAATIFTHNPYETPSIPLGMYHRNGIGTFSWWGYENDEISDAIDDQAQEMDVETRREKVRNVQLMILDDWATAR